MADSSTRENTLADAQPSLTQKDLELLARAIVLAGGVVAAAKFSGARGTASEFAALIEELEAVRRTSPDNPVFRALPMDVVSRETTELNRQLGDDMKQGEYQDFKMSALNRVSQAREILQRKATPEQTDAYCQAVLRICERVANASKEGRVMGLGGTAVDVRETGVIEEIRRVVGVA
jgi:hypothetical protein